MTARTTRDVQQQIVASWNGGEKVLQIADRLRTSETTVRRILKSHGIEIAPGGVRVYPRLTTAEQDAEIVRRYADGETAKALAREFGLATHHSVLRRVRDAGQPIPARPGPCALPSGRQHVCLDCGSHNVGLTERQA